MVDAKVVEIESIGKAAKLLKAIQRNWFPYHLTSHRRLDLINQNYPTLKEKMEVPSGHTTNPIGSYTLLDDHTMLYSIAWKLSLMESLNLKRTRLIRPAEHI